MKSRFRILFPFTVITLLMAACQPGSDSQFEPDYSMLGECAPAEQPMLSWVTQNALCGKIEVFENRAEASGKKIALNVMVLPAGARVKKPDPVFFLAGGPGQSATEVGPVLFSILPQIREQRDVILLDQRGTGDSSPLDCISDEDPFAQTDLSLEEAQLQQVNEMRQCLDGYEVDPAQFTTPVAMDDLDEVRQTFGFQTINLYGVSYGTRAALVYLRRHPDAVRSLILDAVAPLTMTISSNVAVDAQHAMNMVFSDCERDKACSTAFPDLREHFQQLLQRLELDNSLITISHPRTGQIAEVLADPRFLTRLMRGVLYDRSLSALLPLAIEEAYAGRYQPLVTMGYSFGGEGNGMSAGMMASVLCAEDMKITSSANDADLQFDNAIYRVLAPICKFWPTGDIPSDYFEPVHSDKPVILTSGTLDPITPPQYAEDARKTLTNAVHVVVPGVGHGATMAGCMPAVLVEFLDDLSPTTMDTSCALQMRRPPFFTSMAGPAGVSVRDNKHDVAPTGKKQ